MEKLSANVIRDMFRDFFVSKGHYAGGSASLVPSEDKSLMLINSGMAPLKPYFSGAETPPAKRMTTCQKCIRTNDIENVGKTARHGTFFEMLGNFSFGDYFKKESIEWGWEFVTKYLKLPEDRLWATVYENDDEAYNIWKDVIGIPEERIVRLGKDDNFWEIGLGPCGPCSEIYYDRGPEWGCDRHDCKPGCECDRYLEFWNHVFTQFSKEEDGSYTDLDHPNIDTGMGLERIACIMQDVDSIFDIDTIKYSRDAITDMAGVKYEGGSSKNDISVRIITDHLRSMVFMIGDGVLPSNEGRGYILRRIIRRAARHAKLLGIKDSNAMTKLADTVIEVSGGAYPELIEKRDYIKKMIKIEEDNFARTLDNGMEILEGYMEELKESGSKELSGDKVFKLYDTYGFPVEVTQEILEENGMLVDMQGFTENMNHQKSIARANQKSTEEEAWRDASGYTELPHTIFTGYETEQGSSKIQYIGNYDSTRKFIISEETPFYATSGGQVYDTGTITSGDKTVRIVDVLKDNGIYLHIVDPEDSGIVDGFEVGAEIELKIDSIRRHNVARSHSATHLLQKALQEVLGDHVLQAGSYVDEKYLRFDFNHYQAVTSEELKKIEDIVNEKIDLFLPISMQEMPLEEAKKMGAMAIFGEKYGKIVRVVSMGDFSVEFCGGTHMNNTGMIGNFKITGEAGIASGVRRIEAITGTNVTRYLSTKEELIREVGEVLKSTDKDIVRRASQLVAENKELENTLKDFKSQEIMESLDEILNSAVQVGDIKLITKKFEDTDIEQLRKISDAVKDKTSDVIMVFAAINDGKLTFIASVSDDLVGKGYHAGKIIKTVAATAGGGGGGKANMAQAGAKDVSKVDAALEKAADAILQ